MTMHMLARAVPLFTQLTAALMMLALPHITRRDLLFGVPIPPGFRSTDMGRSALRTYRLWTAIPYGVSLILILLIPNPLVITSAVLLTPILSITAFVSQNRQLKPYAIQPPLAREAELGPPEPLPKFVLLGILPLLFLGGSALYLNSHWDQIPDRYPVHFDINGTPNRWSDRSVRGVYGPLMLGGELAIWLFALAVAGWYGSRRSDAMRKPMVIVMLAVETTIALLFGQIPLQTTGLVHIPVLLMVFGPLIVLIPVMWYAVHESNKPRDPIDPTPNECWKGGIIYYNPNDAVLFVQRRDGIGFTVNLGNRWSWALYGSLLLVLGSIPLVLR